MSDKSTITRLARRGFTLVEVLMAVFILGIGLIMVITVFPVGGEWTRQATDSTISQTVAQNALAILQTHCPPTSQAVAKAVANNPNSAQCALVSFPGLAGSPIRNVSLGPTHPDGRPKYVMADDDATVIPVTEMCYRFGVDSPSPADPLKALYFWTALVRKVPDQPPGPTTNYDVYILVFKKGSVDQVYPANSNQRGYVTVDGDDYLEFWNDTASASPHRSTVRDSRNYPGQPTIALVPYINPTDTGMELSSGKIIIKNSTKNRPLRPAIDEYGIGALSGTVFRQGVYHRSSGAVQNGVDNSVVATPRPMLHGQGKNASPPPPESPVDEHVIIGIPAEGASVSPLVYVYQTTLSWKTP